MRNTPSPAMRVQAIVVCFFTILSAAQVSAQSADVGEQGTLGLDGQTNTGVQLASAGAVMLAMSADAGPTLG